MATDNRTPNWSCIVYPDSLPVDWISQVEETGVEVCVSPLHDCDVWTHKDEMEDPKHVEGQPKKPHRHVVIMYGKSNKKSIDQVKEDFGFLNGTKFKKVKSLIGMIQYLDHRFCTTKHHYDERDVQAFNGFDYEEVVNAPTDKQIRMVLREIRLFVRSEGIYDFCVLQDYVDDNEELIIWSKVIEANQFKLAGYITSRRCKRNDEKRGFVDPVKSTEKSMREGFDEDAIFDEASEIKKLKEEMKLE